GIAQAANAVARIEYYGSSDDRTEQRSAADFIDSSHVLCARSPSPLFKIKSAAQSFQQTQLGGGGRNAVCFRMFRCGARLGHGCGSATSPKKVREARAEFRLGAPRLSTGYL